MTGPQKTEALINPNELVRSEFAALRSRAEELRREARIADRVAIFVGAWMQGGRFRVMLPNGQIQDVEPHYPRHGGPLQAFWNARSEAEYWAKRAEPQ